MRRISTTAIYTLVCAAASFLNACCTDDATPLQTHYSIQAGDILAGVGGIELDWDYETPFLSYAEGIVVWIGRRPPAEMIEVYDGATRIGLAGVLRDDVPLGGCSYSGLVYDLRGLPSGDYRLVHRRNSAPSGLESAWARDHGWEIYEGEEALVMTLRLDGGAVTDGGM